MGPGQPKFYVFCASSGHSTRGGLANSPLDEFRFCTNRIAEPDDRFGFEDDELIEAETAPLREMIMATEGE